MDAGAPWPNGTLMARLGSRSQRDLLDLADRRPYSAGQVLINEGEPREHVFVLASDDPESDACVKVTATCSNGAETLLGIRVRGDAVGELAALRDGRRTARVTACTKLTAHYISHKDFLAFLHSHEDAWEALCRMIAGRLDWANRRRLDYAGYDVPKRLARVLLELVETYGRPAAGGHDLGVRLSQAELGALIGAKPDAVSLAIRELRTADIVSSTYRNVMINDLVALHKFVDH